LKATQSIDISNGGTSIKKIFSEKS